MNLYTQGNLLDYCLPTKNYINNQQADPEKDVNVARCGALALWSCSKSTKNKQVRFKICF